MLSTFYTSGTDAQNILWYWLGYPKQTVNFSCGVQGSLHRPHSMEYPLYRNFKPLTKD